MLKKIKAAVFKFQPFSKKQMKILTWWLPTSPMKDKDGVIADGAIRSGKTLSMSLSFVLWAFFAFDQQNFGMCGKTIGSFRRNVLFWLKLMLRARGYKIKDQRADNLIIISKNGKVNYFYIFGGKDERSQDLIQGITLAGVFFDEVALMPESFVSQATGRCSVDGSKYWFNCNPAGPYHWFKVNWIDKKKDKKLIYLHFTMDDNLSLSENVKERYRRMFAGVFYKRYILGLWVMAEGIIYDMFDKDEHVVKTEPRRYTDYKIASDYGTQNPMAFGLWGLCDGVWYKVKEYHYDGRQRKIQKTDEQYANDLEEFAEGLTKTIVVDPSASSFIILLKKRGWVVKKARNDVLQGIRNMATALSTGLIKYNDVCKETLREIHSYVWDEKAIARGEDKPVKQNDHQMDADRYFVNTILFNDNIKFLK
ncbi:PBSX family phage terminase large subunit [Mesobacillus stamsii]|uniref:PBSX family phage terminase large subunit n=1 Tax=Mesobacillus stamsii TaxID=225347 RepID=A0ABU0FS12_9BACI|nr:PBSX family phage terminase large subunit [Mesobacillus stamsii]MDQ0412712.1 PBSX family phage terminase large subunit [Mesobacillus stamsii]